MSLTSEQLQRLREKYAPIAAALQADAATAAAAAAAATTTTATAAAAVGAAGGVARGAKLAGVKLCEECQGAGVVKVTYNHMVMDRTCRGEIARTRIICDNDPRRSQGARGRERSAQLYVSCQTLDDC
jgi:hypothetical protein